MNDIQEEISVVVPVFRAEKYLRACVDSLLAQTYRPLEILLVDDCSDDGSGTICDEYAAAHENVRVIRQPENRGVGAARNAGVRESRGAFVAFVDADDYVEAGYIANLYALLKRFDADISTSTLRRETEGEPLPAIEGAKPPFCTSGNEALRLTFVTNEIQWAVYGKLYKRALLEKTPIPEIRIYEDFAFMRDLFDTNGDARIAVDEGISDYHYIYRPSSILTGEVSEKTLSIFPLCDEVAKLSGRIGIDAELVRAELYRAAVLQILNLVRMGPAAYRHVFRMHRRFFRRMLWPYLRAKEFSREKKISYLLLCTTTFIYKTGRLMHKHRRRREK